MHDHIDQWAEIFGLSICDDRVRSKQLTNRVDGHATYIAWPEQQVPVKVPLRHQSLLKSKLLHISCWVELPGLSYDHDHLFSICFYFSFTRAANDLQSAFADPLRSAQDIGGLLPCSE